MSDPFIKYTFHNEAIAALAQVEKQVAAIRRAIEEDARQSEHPSRMTAAWAKLPECERARFCKEYGLVLTPSAPPSPYRPQDKGKIERDLGRALRTEGRTK